MPFTRETKLITIPEATKILPVSVGRIRKLMVTGQMRGAKYGNRWMTTPDWVCEYIEQEGSRRRNNWLATVCNGTPQGEQQDAL